MRTLLTALTATAALTLAGCGGDGDTADQGTAADSPSETGAPSESAGESAGESASGSATPSPETQLSDAGKSQAVTIRGDQVTPSAKRVDLGVGERLSVTVTSDRAGELHVHSSPEQELSFRAGTTALDIVVQSPGLVEVEEHESDAVILRLYVS
jgi:hypothetical protein